jgi:hypothetical protein
LLIDEADLFAPQKPQAGDQQLLGETENIVRRGRNKGIGITLGTQRPAVLNKDVLTQVDGLIVGRMLGPNDRNAIDNWVGAHGDTKQGKAIKDELPDLGTGECWVWIPEQGVLKKVTVRESRTFDSSPTRKRNSKARRLKLADVDLEAIQETMKTTIEKAKQEDPKELRKEIVLLKRKLHAEIDAKEPAPAEPVEVEVKVPVLREETRGDLRSLAQRLEGSAAQMSAAASDIEHQLDRADEIVGKASSTPPPRPKPAPAPARAASPQRRSSPEPAEGGSGDLNGPQQRVLDALAWLDAVGFPRPSKIQVGFIAGYRVGKKVGGTFGNILGQLRASGLIDYPTPGQVELISQGRDLATVPDIEQTPEGLQRAIMDRLDGPEQRVLSVLISGYPNPQTKQGVGAAAGYAVGEKIGGTYGNILGRLRSLGLIDYPSPGQVVALPVLFLEGV